MRDHPDIPLDTAAARSALQMLSEAQRLALAMEVINQAADPASCLQLARIETLARVTAQQIARADHVNWETRRCL